MSMNLTQDDLQAVRGIVQDVVYDVVDAAKRELKADIKAVDYKVDEAFELIKQLDEKLGRVARQTQENIAFIMKLKQVLQ